MKRGLACALVLLASTACRSPLQAGESLYRNGDPLAALETWRQVPPGHREYASVQQRIGVAREEFDRLVTRYKRRARYYEERGQLGESILNYRLGLRLEPDDAQTLDHVQLLARRLAEEKRLQLRRFRDSVERGELSAAQLQLSALRELDPFDPELEREQRELRFALQAEIRERLERGRGSLAAGDPRGAERSFREALALDPENDDARGLLSYVAQLLGDPAGPGALPLPLSGDLSGYARIRAEGQFQNALRAEQAGRHYAAIRHLLRALQMDPGHAAARERLAQLRVRLTPDVDALLRAGRDAFRNEDLETALEQWRRALLIDPQNARASAYISRAERQLANLERLRSEPLEVD